MRTKLLLLLMVWSVGALAQKAKPVKAHKPKERPDKYFVYCPAEYPGGNDSLTKYMKLNVRYPESAIEARIQGRVRVRFFINEEGQATELVILRGISEDCDQEIAHQATTMPRWQPATFNGKPVKSLYYLNVMFRLE